MKEEYDALMWNGTWVLVNLSPRGIIIRNIWSFETKTKPDKTLISYKTRLVVQGFSQTTGVDYSKTFSLVVKDTTTGLCSL